MKFENLSNPASLCAVSMLIAIALYKSVLGFDFVWDDVIFLKEGPKFRDLSLMFQGMGDPFLNSQNYFRPLVLMMFTIEQSYSQGSPEISHLVNLCFFLGIISLTSLLTYKVALHCEFSELQARVACGLAGLVYVLHPVLVEPVAWISGRFDLAVAFFGLLLLIADISIVSTIWRALAVSVCFLLAALSKEMALGIALALPIWHLLLSPRISPSQSPWGCWTDRKNMAVYLGIFAAGMLYLGLRSKMLGHLYQPDAAAFSPTYTVLSQHIALVFKATGQYVLLALWPFSSLSPLHEYTLPISWTEQKVLIGIGTWAIAFPLLFSVLNGRYRILCIPLCFLVSLMPVLHLVPMQIGNSFVHERFMVLPLSFVAMFAGWGLVALWPLKSRFKPMPLVMGIFALLWSALCFANIQINLSFWQDELHLWTLATLRHPDSQSANNNLMVALISSGQTDKAFELANKIRDQQGGNFYPLQQVNFAHLLYQREEYDEALKYLRGAEAALNRHSRTSRVPLYQLLGLVTLETGTLEDARAYFRKSLDWDARSVPSLHMMAATYYAEGNRQEGDKYLKQCLSYARPDDVNQIRTENKILVERILGQRQQPIRADTP